MAPKTSSDSLPVRVGEVPANLVALLSDKNSGLADSLDTMRHHRILNRLVIIQAQSKREVKDKFGEGTVVVPTAEQIITDKKGTFQVVPVMFFDEFVVWNDRNDKEGPMIHARSLDRASEIAVRSADAQRRQEAYGPEGKFKRKFTHHLNFPVVIYSGPLKGTLAVMSFSRGEFRKGMSFISAIKMRRIVVGSQSVQAPLWSTVWDVTVGERKNEKGEWYGFDLSPAQEPIISNDDVASMRTMHEELKKEYREQTLGVGHEAAENTGGGSDPDLSGATDM